MKILTIPQRAANNWYSSKLKKYWCEFVLVCTAISYLVVGLCIWAVGMSILDKISKMITTWFTT